MGKHFHQDEFLSHVSARWTVASKGGLVAAEPGANMFDSWSASVFARPGVCDRTSIEATSSASRSASSAANVLSRGHVDRSRLAA